MYTGPNIIKDGLVFGYDTGYGIADNNTVTRFYPGEPATNNSILAGYTWAGDGGNQSFANKGATAITDNSLKYNGYDTVLWTPGSSQNCYLNGTGDFNYSDGSNVWTFSCYVRREDGAAITSLNVYMYYPSSDGSAAGTIVDCGNGWYRVSRTRTGGTSAIQLAGFTGFSSGNKYYLSGVMLSKTSHTVPYVAVQSSRSSTASLIDLKETTDIDVSNVSFDSTGQPTFDGSNDGINLGTSNLFNQFAGEFAIDTWVRRVNAGGGWGNIIGDYYTNSTANSLEWQMMMSASGQLNVYNVTGGYIISPVASGFGTDTWVNVVLSRVGSTVSLYANSNLIASTTNTTTFGSATGNVNIGVDGNSSSEPFAGDISALKIYNRGLTASEIKQNFNAYKNRFDI